METKTVIESHQGCVYSFSIDGKYQEELSEEELDKVIEKILNRLKNEIRDKHITLEMLMENIEPDEEECDYEVCETCGSIESSQRWFV